MYVAKQRAPRLLAYLPMPEKSERPVLLSCQRWPCCAPWSPRAGRSLPRRFPLPAPFWARLPVSRAQKKILPAQQAQKKKPPRVPVVSGRGAGAGAGLRPMYATKKRAPQWLSYLPMSQKNERLWPPSPISGKTRKPAAFCSSRRPARHKTHPLARQGETHENTPPSKTHPPVRQGKGRPPFMRASSVNRSERKKQKGAKSGLAAGGSQKGQRPLFHASAERTAE